MLHPMWTYYPTDEVARALEHIDVLVERGTAPELAIEDAARIYRQRTGDFCTPYIRAHLSTQWRTSRRADTDAILGPLEGVPRYGRKPQLSKYPTEVSFRASFHRLFYE